MAWKTWNTPEDHKSIILLRYLGGEARREILVMGGGITAKEMLDILRDIYGDKTPVTSLLAKFYALTQERSESIRNYALTLQMLERKVKGRSPELVQENMLRDKFVEGIRSPSIRSEMKREIRKKPTVTFSELKNESIAIESELSVNEETMALVNLQKTSSIDRTQKERDDQERKILWEEIKEIRLD
ncbi:hypothetical protein BSL78_04267 [Apostichopus japonicus]|uniref:Paraneoplastic antigen Ma-like C-terminal domain-containing protein n=1 Tax=Stichopus japonicus TaxID=307972 RepID=A0A2G8LEX1_STIJA|nr:hypothetical protein BSL78_04267 [Apostichopus japonicus]